MIPAPFKCVGGKSKLVDRLASVIPTDAVRGYCEPFLGGGALFRHLAATGRLDNCDSMLSDAGPGVYRTWLDIKQNPSFTSKSLAEFEFEYNRGDETTRKEMYLRERKRWNAGGVTGARHIFLRNTAFNGLWRVNKSGGMNVPWGKYKSFNAPDILPLHAKLIRATVANCPWAVAVQQVKPGWLVYLDPPYVSEFDGYTASGFDLSDQVQLLQWCQTAAKTGVHVVYSNRYQTEVQLLMRDHWPNATIHRAVRNQTVAALNHGRGVVEELIGVSGE